MRRSRVGPGLDGKLAGINERRGKAGCVGVISNIDGLRVGERALAFWGLGQVGVAIKGPEGVLYVDPYLTDSDGEGAAAWREPFLPRSGRTRSPTPTRFSSPTTT